MGESKKIIKIDHSKHILVLSNHYGLLQQDVDAVWMIWKYDVSFQSTPGIQFIWWLLDNDI